MTVYVDSLVEHADPKDAQARRAGSRWKQNWCHMFTDSDDLTELHTMAARIGLRMSWFQDAPGKLPHYDLTPPRRAKAVALGAAECGREMLVACIRRWRGTTP